MGEQETLSSRQVKEKDKEDRRGAAQFDRACQTNEKNHGNLTCAPQTLHDKLS